MSGVHEAVWILSFISFIFLYPSTFNLLEVRHTLQSGGFAVRNLRMCFKPPTAWMWALYVQRHSTGGLGQQHQHRCLGPLPLFCWSKVCCVWRKCYNLNSAQVAAVDEPKLHLWDTGVIRITRHPQARLPHHESVAPTGAPEFVKLLQRCNSLLKFQNSV